jgi:hypothetical protein
MNEGEEIIIQRPPKIYLDTNHLINITRVRKGQKLPQGQSEGDYKRLDECIKSYCGLIFNQAATLEWVEGKATAETASKIAAVVDSANLKYLFEADYLIYTWEVLDLCHRQNPSIQVPELPIFQKLSDNITFFSARGILANQVPDYLEEDELGQLEKKAGTPIKIPIASVRQWVEETLKLKCKNPELYKQRITDFKAQLAYDIENKNVYFNDRQSYRKDWLKRVLKIERILKAFNPKIDIDSVLDKIDAIKCPAVRLYWAVREKRMKSGNPPNDNDVDDYMYIPVVPYADIVLIEKNLRAFILQADKNLESKVFSNASNALNALVNQKFTY